VISDHALRAKADIFSVIGILTSPRTVNHHFGFIDGFTDRPQGDFPSMEN